MNMKVGLHDMKIGLYSGFKTQRSEGHNVFSSGLRAVRNAHHNGKEFVSINSDLGEIKNLLDHAKKNNNPQQFDIAHGLIKEARVKVRLMLNIFRKVLKQKHLAKYSNTLKNPLNSKRGQSVATNQLKISLKLL